MVWTTVIWAAIDRMKSIPNDIVEMVLISLIQISSDQEASTIRTVSRLARSVVDSHTQLNDERVFILGLTRMVSLLPREAYVMFRTRGSRTMGSSYLRGCPVAEFLVLLTCMKAHTMSVEWMRITLDGALERDGIVTLKDRFSRMQQTRWWKDEKACKRGGRSLMVCVKDPNFCLSAFAAEGFGWFEWFEWSKWCVSEWCFSWRKGTV